MLAFEDEGEVKWALSTIFNEYWIFTYGIDFSLYKSCFVTSLECHEDNTRQHANSKNLSDNVRHK